MANRIKKLANGYELSVTLEVSSGVSANCGMQCITGVSIQCSKPPNPRDSFSDRQYVYNTELEAIINTHWDWIAAYVSGCVQRSLVLISDRMLYLGSNEAMGYNFRTKDFIRELIKRKEGSVTVSPLVANKSYDEGAHDIQAVFWVPSKFSHTVVKAGKYYADTKQKKVVPYKAKHEAAYDGYMKKGISKKRVTAGWKDPKPKKGEAVKSAPEERYGMFFRGGERTQEFINIFAANRARPVAVAAPPPAPPVMPVAPAPMPVRKLKAAVAKLKERAVPKAEYHGREYYMYEGPVTYGDVEATPAELEVLERG